MAEGKAPHTWERAMSLSIRAVFGVCIAQPCRADAGRIDAGWKRPFFHRDCSVDHGTHAVRAVIDSLAYDMIYQLFTFIEGLMISAVVCLVGGY